MKIFETKNKLFRLLAYDGLNLDLIDRHREWCNSNPQNVLPIYMVFFVQEPKEKRLWKSNRLENKFCIVYLLEKERDQEWMKRFCRQCYLCENDHITNQT